MKDAAIGIIIFDEKILLAKRRDVPVWVLPGGGIDEGEEPEKACIREVYEETGVKVSIERKVGLWLPINRLASSAHVFQCTISAMPDELAPQEESQEVQFFPLNSLPKTFFFLHRSWLDTALKNTPERVYIMQELTYFRAIKLLVCHPILSFRYLLSRIGLPFNN